MTRLATSEPTLHASRRTTRSNEQRKLIVDLYRYSYTTEAKAVLSARTGLTTEQLYQSGSRYDATKQDACELPFDPASRWKLRDDPAHTRFTALEDAAIRRLWPATDTARPLRIEALAALIGKTETAIAYRARQLQLRNVARFYEAERVRAWFGLHFPTRQNPNEVDELAVLEKFSYGLLHPCTDLDGNVVCTLVSTSALARLLIEAEEPVSDGDDRYTQLRKRFMRKLLDERNPDQFFIKDIVEGVREISSGAARFEPSPWISHGMTDLHPLSGTRGLFLFEPHSWEELRLGALRPQDLHPDERLDADDWQPRWMRRPGYTLGRDPVEELGLSLADLRELAG